MASTALATDIVSVLRSRGPLPVDYLAKIYGRRPSELRDYIDELKEKKLITSEENERDGEVVSLTARRSD